MGILETEGLTKYYGRSRGIEDLSLRVEEGEIFGFIGPNGAGKTTTIRLLLGLLFPTRGKARILGKDLLREGPEIRRHVGYLPAEVAYYEGMRVGDLLHYAAGFYPGDHRQRIRELAEYMDLDLNRRVETLSFGNKKKVGIVLSLLHAPRLLFLDEPTAGLDPLIQRRFYDLIRRENQERGVTVFFSSHVLSEVQRLCHRVAIIREGRLVEVSDIRTLQRNSYKKVAVTAQGLDPEAFRLPGVANLEVENGTLRFYFRGDINEILQRLARLRVEDIRIEDPSLEEIFLHYYE